MTFPPNTTFAESGVRRTVADTPFDRERRISLRRDRIVNAAILAVSVTVPAFGRGMRFDVVGGVWFSALPGYSLPTLCPSRWLGIRCLGCGMTRSIIALMHGDVAASLALNPAGWLVLFLIVAQIPYRLHRIVRPDHRTQVIERLGFTGLVVVAAVAASGRVLEFLSR